MVYGTWIKKIYFYTNLTFYWLLIEIFLLNKKALIKIKKVINAQISVQESNPILEITNGAMTVKNPPDSINWAKSCFDVKIGRVLEIFLGSASLKSNRPEATTPVEFPNSIKLFSNQ